jgi:predicted metalloprotease
MKSTFQILNQLLTVIVLFGLLSSGLTVTNISASQSGDETRFQEVIRLAVGGDGQPGDLNEFWRRTLEQYDPTISYAPPTAIEPYVGEAGTIGPCPLLQNNASYCLDDQTVAWDEAWLFDLFSDIGDVAPLAILAHEWGHHIQHLLNIPGERQSATHLKGDIQSELQADCFAALYLVDVERRGLLGENQDAILWGGLTFFVEGNGEYAESQWFAEDEHGPPASRALAFTSGFFGSTTVENPELTYCLNYTSYIPKTPLKAGAYALNLPPGTELEEVPEEGLIRLQHPMARTIVAPQPSLPAQPARDQLDAVQSRYFAKFTVREIGDVFDVFMGTLGGSAVAQAYERSWTEAGKTLTVHGLLALQVSPMGGGLVLDVFAPGPAPASSEGWDPLIAHLFVLAIGVCAPGAPQESVACLFSELTSLELPELFVRASTAGITLSTGDRGPVVAGRTLVRFVNHDIEPERLVGLLLVKLGGTLDDQQLATPVSPGEQPPDWFYDGTIIGSPLVLPEGRTQMVVDLTPGNWVVVGVPDFRPVSFPFTIEPTTPAAKQVEEPPAALSVVERDNAIVGLDKPVQPGHQIWKVSNEGSQPHRLSLFRFPHAVTDEEALEVIERIRLGDDSPVSGLDFAPQEAELVGSVGALSSGQTVWVEHASLIPGHYAAVCVVPDPTTGRRHETMGELQLFEITSS